MPEDCDQHSKMTVLNEDQSKKDVGESIDRESTGYSDGSTLCQERDFLSLTDEDRAVGQAWLQYIPRRHPVTGVAVQTVYNGKKRPRFRGFLVFIICLSIVMSSTMSIFSAFQNNIQVPAKQFIAIYYGLLSLASILLSLCIGSIISVSVDKWQGKLPPFIRRLDILFILSCGQWSVIREICTANSSYFVSLLTNLAQTVISQIFNLAFAGGDVFQLYATIITTIGSWYSIVPILIGTAFTSTYLFSIIKRIVYFPTDRDSVRRFVLGSTPGCYVVGPAENSCVHRQRDHYVVRHSKSAKLNGYKDLEKNPKHYEYEVPLMGWEAVHFNESVPQSHNVQMYLLTDGSIEEVQRTIRWAIATNENVYLQGYFECGLCACSMAQLLRCNFVVVQHSCSLPPPRGKKDRSQRLYNSLPKILSPWCWFSHA
ncbi:hypothetical protein BGW37DRAFT_521736 [Umbelopsis sp. PMI_123]|nr:hypothetical protein BGW37DRAFT_521736 [Umbelopsis sp. PMI_123]